MAAGDKQEPTVAKRIEPAENHPPAEKPVMLAQMPEITGPGDAPRIKLHVKGSGGDGYTKEPYSPDVSAAAFSALKEKTGVDLLSPGKWDAKTPEQKWWTQAMASAHQNRDQLPPGLEIKAMAATGVGGAKKVNDVVGTKLEDSGRADSMYLAGSIAKSDTWTAKAKSMDIKDENGNPVQNPNRPDGRADSIYKDGTVYNVDGVKVFEIHKDDSGARTFAIADPGNLPHGMDYNAYAQKLITKAMQTEGKPGKIEFPAYEKKVEQNLDGLLHMGVKGTDFEIAQAKMNSIWAANKDGKFAIEKQSFEIRSRGLHLEPPDPPAERLDRSKFMVAETTSMGRVYMAARFDAAKGDLKVPDIEKLKREAGYTGK